MAVVVVDHTHLLLFGLLVPQEKVEELVVLEIVELEVLELQTVAAEAVDPVLLQPPVEQGQLAFVQNPRDVLGAAQ